MDSLYYIETVFPLLQFKVLLDDIALWEFLIIASAPDINITTTNDKRHDRSSLYIPFNCSVETV